MKNSKMNPAKIVIATLTLSLVLASCGTPSVQEKAEDVKTHTFSNGETLNYRHVDGLIVSDDIIVGTEQEFPGMIDRYEEILVARKDPEAQNNKVSPQGVGIIKNCDINFFFTTCQDSRWKDGKVYYSVDNTFSQTEKQSIALALADWNLRVTGVKWIYQPSAPNRVAFTRETDPNACGHSSIGYKGGVQQLRLQCFKQGVIQHEMGHAVGLFHEQSRCDRDNFVTIQWANIKSGYSGNFNKACGNTVSDYGTYNYKSVMHYGAYGFSSNGKPTIVPKNGVALTDIGQREALDAGDISAINKMYAAGTVKYH
ncbi:M12 family metallopeptidase [Deinococcus cellulosilyticus]|uniref:Peptidase M12A domain-containing protein n=1 Tax=Deinococcus cellulosilyticus (strain DSM 18568 / NBRC 106333 / KACC 11606 / 5516J-15) TaxID=1223518 RepID=A0A511N9P4_DEIC1|nr:M12 family metallopeptidase [Deinococcus cellulosilyticus]GEM49277.1 hypothetical protein DC3_49120 [Deinococcus cellulosilyticus NBRC 106333 = KACC 11606]